MLSLRRLLTIAALLLCLLPTLLGGLAISLWLMPRLEQQAVSANMALAQTLAQQTGLYLETPLNALLAGAGELRSEKRDALGEQTILDWLMRSNPNLQAVYLLDARQQVFRVSLREHKRLQTTDLIGLDLSRLPGLQPGKATAANRWSEVFLSSISGEPAVAAMVQAGPNTLIGEISLTELSRFVSHAAISKGTRMSIMDEHGQVIADPDPALAHAYFNRSHIPLFGQARDNGAASGRFLLDEADHVGSALRVDPQGWVVLVAEPAQQALQAGWHILGALALIGTAMLAFSLSFGLVCAQWLARRTEMLARIASHAASHEFDFPWPDSRVLEYRQLLDSLHHMFDAIRSRERALTEANDRLEERVQERTLALSEANEELSVTIEHLQQARDDLTRAERQAALGRLVAGVAHELNTPIGNSLIVASALHDQSKEFSASVEHGLTRRQLAQFREQCEEATGMITLHLHKAAELIQDFKQVAVDQATAQRRQFELAEVLGEMARMLGPMLRRTPFTLKIDAAADIRMDSYPGPLGQVVSNLVQNAILHGYAGREQGEVQVKARAGDDGYILITVADSGSGISPEVLPHIFDPFFTTRMGQGGTGLGLHIVHQMVTELLGGSVEVRSTPGQGSCFTLRVPASAP